MVLDTDIPHFNIRHNSTRKCKNDATNAGTNTPPLQAVSTEISATNPKAGMFSRRLKKATGLVPTEYVICLSIVCALKSEYSIAMAIVGHKAHGQTAHYGEVSLLDKYNELTKLK